MNALDIQNKHNYYVSGQLPRAKDGGVLVEDVREQD